MWFRDLGYAARGLRKNPVFAATAVITIALGLGASAAIFSVTNAVLLRPLPYKNPDRLVFVIAEMTNRNVKDFPFSHADFIDLRSSAAEAFDDIAAVSSGRSAAPRQDGSLEEIRWASVTPDFFRVMGAKISLGRDFEESEGRPQSPEPAGSAVGQPPPQPSSPMATILSYEYWQRRFGGDKTILGHDVPGMRPGTTQIVGVLAPGFELLHPPDANIERLPDCWFVARLIYDGSRRNTVSLRAVGRLKDGLTMERAQSVVDVVGSELRKKSVIWETSGWRLRLEPMQKHVVEEVRPALLALTGAVIILLLIACANVSNLLLVRASMREREIAIRTALGGRWWRLVSQTLSEALLIAAAGAPIGLGLAWLGIRELRAISPARLPRLDSIAIDPAVLAFTAFAALASAAILGMPPALRAMRPDMAQVLRAGGRAHGLRGARMMRNGVVIAEVALSFVLLIGSGLMLRSFVTLQQISPGYDPRSLLTFHLLGRSGGSQPQQRAAFIREIRDRLRALPGVLEVTASTPFPLAGGFNAMRWGKEEALADPSRYQSADYQAVLPGYFETLRTPLLAGRTFTDMDNTPERKLVVIDQFLAAKAFPNESAVGKRLLIGINMPVEVVGVVAHQRATSLAEPGREQVFFTDGYMEHGRVSRWALRTAGNPAQYAGAVRAEIAKFGSRVILTEMQPMEALVESAQAKTRFSLLLLGVFAVIAAVLAAVGLYGVLSTVVRQRTAEIGVRMALGATPAGIFHLVVGQGLRLSVAGIVVGVVAAFGLAPVMSSMLVGVQPTDPATFVGICALFLIVAAAASWLPARRAAAVDPRVALHEE